MSSIDPRAGLERRRERAAELAGEIRTLASHLHAGHAVLAEKLAEFDALEGWHGFRSCADWLGLNAAIAATGGAPAYPSARMNLRYVVGVLLERSPNQRGQPPG